ncbi:MAG: hypothetical protein R3240_06630, partial [Gammaproteobacteria bacterium]|nr:hypothetical protein [Gammaproteobacteria bacterium]
MILLHACSSSSTTTSEDESTSSKLFSLQGLRHLLWLNSANGGQLVGLDETGNLKTVFQSDEQIAVDHTVLSPDGNYVYLMVSAENEGLSYILQQNCSLLKVSLADNSSSCVLRGYFYSNWQNDPAWQLIKNQSGPLQFDSAGNAYLLVRKFLSSCDSNCVLGTEPGQYQQYTNNNAQSFYLQNRLQMHRIDSENNKTAYLLDSTQVMAMQVLSDNRVALVTQNDGDYYLQLLLDGQTNASVFSDTLNSLLVDRFGSFVVNNQWLFEKTDSGYSPTSINHELRHNVNLQLAEDQIVYDVDATLVYKALPFQLRAVAELTQSDAQLVFGKQFILEPSGSDVIVHDMAQYLSYKLLEHLAVNATESIQGSVVISKGILYFVTANADNTKFYLYAIKESSLGKASMATEDVSKIALTSASTGIAGALVLNAETAQADFTVNQWQSLPENRNSVSLELSQPPALASTDLFTIADTNQNTLSAAVLSFGNYLHVFPDTSGKTDNQIFEGALQGQGLPEWNSNYTFTISDTLANTEGATLTVGSANNTFELQTAVESGVYHAGLDSFQRQFGTLPAGLAEGGIIANPACQDATCNDFYFNTGISRAGNVRIEFSSSGHFSHLAL